MELFEAADPLGPAKILAIREPAVGLRAIVVVDNVAIGPAIGGCRMAPDVSLDECARLARAMTLKNAAASLPHGGGKSVIFADPAMPLAAKERLIRAFARAIETFSDYIVGPDMGTDERAMAWVKDEIGRAVGLPRTIGGIPLDEIGATGYGVSIAAEVAAAHAGIRLQGARVAVQGYGAVGRNAARFLAERGAVLVAASDIDGAAIRPEGLDLAALDALKAEGRSVAEIGGRARADRDAVIGVDCDIWIPAARPDVIDARNVGALRAKLVLQGANIPITAEAEAELHRRGVVSVPDFIVNAGGVIAASVEYHGGSERLAMETIAEKVRGNTRAVLDEAERTGRPPREAALALARRRVEEAMGYGRFGPRGR